MGPGILILRSEMLLDHAHARKGTDPMDKPLISRGFSSKQQEQRPFATRTVRDAGGAHAANQRWTLELRPSATDPGGWPWIDRPHGNL